MGGLCAQALAFVALSISHNNKRGLSHFTVPTGGVNATRKMAQGEHLVLWDPIPRTHYLSAYPLFHHH